MPGLSARLVEASLGVRKLAIADGPCLLQARGDLAHGADLGRARPLRYGSS